MDTEGPVEVEETRRCGTCRHWHKHAATAVNVARQADPRKAQGDCRANPPGFCPVAIQPNGQIVVIVKYPDPLAVCPACSLYEGRMALVT